MALGWVYVLSNEAMPDLLKIGQSAADPDLRASELYTTGVPRPFFIQYKGLFDDYDRLERRVHAELSHLRESRQREFFKLPVALAVHTIRTLSSGAKYEVCAFVADNQPEQTPIHHLLQRKELPWVAADREQRRSHRLSEHVDQPLMRVLNCLRCGQVMPSATTKCPLCGALGPE